MDTADSSVLTSLISALSKDPSLLLLAVVIVGVAYVAYQIGSKVLFSMGEHMKGITEEVKSLKEVIQLFVQKTDLRLERIEDHVKDTKKAS